MAETSDGGFLAWRLIVTWGDCDPAGIVFYPRFCAWMDNVSHLLAREMGLAREMMLPSSRDPVGFPVVSIQAEFLAPALIDDRVEVRAWVTRVGRSSFGLRHEVHRLEGDTSRLLVRGREERVYVGQDGSGGLSARELSPVMKQVLARFADPEVS